MKTKLSTSTIFFFLVILFLIVTHFTNEYIYDNAFYRVNLFSQVSTNSVDQFLSIKNKYDYLTYLVIPFIVFLRILFSTLIIGIGFLVLDRNIRFNKIYRSVVISDFIFLFAFAIHNVIMFLNKTELTLENASGYFPLSVLSFIGIENVNAQWAIYPLQTLNLFELFYMGAIAWLLARTTKQSFADIFSTVLPSYGLGLLLWITLVAFLTFQLTG